MAVALSIDKTSLEADKLEPAQVHLMPCTIEGDGGADVSHYFTQAIKQDGSNKNDSVFTASFRGRPIKGQQIQVPDGYKGIVLNEPNKPFTEDEDRSLRATHKFDKLTYWNLETAPCSNDAIVRAMAWTQLASAIHSPVSSDKPSLESQGSVAGCR